MVKNTKARSYLFKLEQDIDSASVICGEIGRLAMAMTRPRYGPTRPRYGATIRRHDTATVRPQYMATKWPRCRHFYQQATIRPRSGHYMATVRLQQLPTRLATNGLRSGHRLWPYRGRIVVIAISPFPSSVLPVRINGSTPDIL